MDRFVFILLLFSLQAGRLEGQDTLLFTAGPVPVYGIITSGDTLYMSVISDASLVPPRKFKKDRDMRRYNKLIYNVRKVYPYAKLAGEKFREVDSMMGTLHSEKQQKAYINSVEKEIKAKYQEELENLTITQGRILIKLIDRETGHTSYDLVKQLQGNFEAFLWQTLARLFGSNLKVTFDPYGEDFLINEIVIRIDNGTL
jgi:hypothetical protein